MGNQQERSLAWFAGILEAEGSISVQVYTLPDGRVRLTPFVCVVNADMLILNECERIMAELCSGERAKPRWCKHSANTNKACITLRLDGHSIYPVLKAVQPYIVGEKKRNAEVVLAFMDSRKAGLLLRDDLGRVVRQGYTKAEIESICSIRTHKMAKSSEAICSAPNVIG